jgi:hypothetical protein
MLKKCWHHLKNVGKNVRNISKKCWWKNTDNSSKIIKKIKKVKACGVFGPQSVKWAVLGFVNFIVRLLIHLPQPR